MMRVLLAGAGRTGRAAACTPAGRAGPADRPRSPRAAASRSPRCGAQRTGFPTYSALSRPRRRSGSSNEGPRSTARSVTRPDRKVSSPREQSRRGVRIGTDRLRAAARERPRSAWRGPRSGRTLRPRRSSTACPARPRSLGEDRRSSRGARPPGPAPAQTRSGVTRHGESFRAMRTLTSAPTTSSPGGPGGVKPDVPRVVQPLPDPPERGRRFRRRSRLEELTPVRRARSPSRPRAAAASGPGLSRSPRPIGKTTRSSAAAARSATTSNRWASRRVLAVGEHQDHLLSRQRLDVRDEVVQRVPERGVGAGAQAADGGSRGLPVRRRRRAEDETSRRTTRRARGRPAARPRSPRPRIRRRSSRSRMLWLVSMSSAWILGSGRGPTAATGSRAVPGQQDLGGAGAAAP